MRGLNRPTEYVAGVIKFSGEFSFPEPELENTEAISRSNGSTP